MKENEKHTEDLHGSNALPASMHINPFIIPVNFFETQKDEILNQIKIDNSALADFNSNNTLSPQYFTELKDNILTQVREIQLKEKVVNDGFDVPANYFNTLAETVQSRIVEDAWKENIAEDGFTLPTEYFETLESAITLKIAEDNIKAISTSDGFEIPASYFDSLAQSVKDNIKIDAFANRQAGDNFSIPSGYFDKLEQQIVSRIKQENEAKEETTAVRTLPSRKLNWSLYSAAAILLLIGIGTYFSLDTNTTALPAEKTFTSRTINLKDVSTNDIVSYLAQVSDDDELIDLTQVIEDKTGEPLLIEPEMKDSDIEEYLNYML